LSVAKDSRRWSRAPVGRVRLDLEIGPLLTHYAFAFSLSFPLTIPGGFVRNTGYQPVRPAELHSADISGSADKMPAGRTGRMPVFREHR
jgi:hypothetical protein